MYLAEIFYLLKENEKISIEELYACGANDEYIEFTLENDILEKVDDTYYKAKDADALVEYGRFLLDQEEYKTANSIFNCAYAIDFNNFAVNKQLLYRSLLDPKLRRNRVFKFFDVVYKKLVEEGKSEDANYYLFLIGNIYGFDSEKGKNELLEIYRDKFIELELGDILLSNGGEMAYYENVFRRRVFTNAYYNVDSILSEKYSGKERKDFSFDEMFEKELLLKWLVRKRNLNRNLAKFLEEGNMVDAKKILDIEDERRGLTVSNEYALKVVNSYLTIQNTGVIPVPRYNGDNVFEAINGNNYSLALNLEEKHIVNHDARKDGILYVLLKKVVDLIKLDKIEVCKTESTLNENTEKEIVTLSSKEIQSINAKVDILHNGRIIFLMEAMPQEKRDLVKKYINNNYSDIFAFSIGIEPERRIVLRYKPIIKEYVNLKEVLADAKDAYSYGKIAEAEGYYDLAMERYNEAAKGYELALKIGKPYASVYGGYGITLLKMKRDREAIDCLKVATIIGKCELDGKIDYTDLIERLEYPVKMENRKPKVVMQESEFVEDNKSLVTDEIINDIIGLTSEGEISLEDACKRIGLSEDDTNYIKLLYARDCYYLGNDSVGDKFFKQVLKCEKSERVKELYKEILVNKKYYHNRYDATGEQLIFIKK